MHARAVLPLLLLAAAALSGCAADTPPPGPADDGSDRPDRLSRGRGSEVGDMFYEGNSAVDAAEAVTGPVTALSNLTTLHWSTNESLPGLALEMLLDLGESNSCRMTMGSQAPADRGNGPDRINLLETEHGLSWGFSSGGTAVSAHGGPVDTREVLGGGSGGGGFGELRATLSGEVRLTLLTRGIAPGESVLFPDGASAAVSVTCSAPFALLATRGGDQVLLGDPSSWTGGAGADLFLAGSANVADRMGGSFPAPAVRAASSGFGAHAALLTLTHPDGEEDWTFLPAESPRYLHEGGPGDYAVEIVQAGVDIQIVWAAIWGLDGPFDLRPGLRAESAMDSPF